MSALKTHKGAELSLEIYKGKSVVDYWFDLFEDDDSDMDLSNYEDIIMTFYSKRGGTVIATFDLDEGLSVSGNRISWNASFDDMDLFRLSLTYYHECHGVIGTTQSPAIDDGQKEVLFYGPATVI